MTRTRLEPAERVAVVLYTALVAVMWPSSLFGLLHAESSAVVAGATFFTAGLVALRQYADGRRPPEVLTRALALCVWPGALLTLSLAWRANCGYSQGIVFYLLFVPPAVATAVAMAWVVAASGLRFKGLTFCAAGVLAAIIPVLLGPGLHPQFFAYSAVWGGVMGPIYDEELLIRPGLLAHRALVFLWVAWLLALGAWLRDRGRGPAAAGVATSIAIGAAYLLAPSLGIVTTRGVLDRHLPGRASSGQFVIHFSDAALRPYEARVIGETLRYRAARYAGALGVAPTRPVHVYIFADAGQRARLTGARYTSVTPVWLRDPQMHVLREAVAPDVLAHELVHVFAREFGMPGLRASPAVGLVEGLAVALEPPAGLPALHEQVAAARALAPEAAGRLSDGPSAAVLASMSPLGFWSGRGAATYITTGAFVEWLVARYGAAPLRRAYRCGDFDSAYGRGLDQLAAEWERAIARVPATPEAVALAQWQFSQPSLLERRCPHYVPREQRLTRDAVIARSAGRSRLAGRLFRTALEVNPMYLPALEGWASVELGQGSRPAEVAARLGRAAADSTEAMLLALLGDARRLAGDEAGARRAYRGALVALPPYAHDARASMSLRRSLPAQAVRLVHVAGRHAEVAAALERVASGSPGAGAAWYFAADRWLAAGRPARAQAAIVRIPIPRDLAHAGALRAWRARYARLAGLSAVASREASAAAAAYAAAGLHAPARHQRDRAAEARWAAARSTTFEGTAW